MANSDITPAEARSIAKQAYTYGFPIVDGHRIQAFWSLSMYELPASLLVANAINRYLLN